MQFPDLLTAIKCGIVSLILAWRIKDVDIEGNDDIGYRFMILEQKPWIIKGYLLKRGRERITGYADVTKQELLDILKRNEDAVALELEIKHGCSVSENIVVPHKYFKKLEAELYKSC